jgi:glutamine synthetase
MSSTDYRNFLELSYEELEERNLAIRADRQARVPMDDLREQRLQDLRDAKGVKAVTVLFSDLEGRLHLLDYDKKFLIDSYDNLTFDGSSIRGFTAQEGERSPPRHRLERLLLGARRCFRHR